MTTGEHADICASPAAHPGRVNPRHAMLGADQPQAHWQSPTGHSAGVSVHREFEVELFMPDGARECVPVGGDYVTAVGLADSPKAWQPPGRPGVIRYRDVVTFTGAWSAILPLEDDLPPTPAGTETS